MTRLLAIAAIAVAALFQTGVVAKIVTDRAALLRNGQEVILETGFIDPRDLFRGHFVRLNLEISRIEGQNIQVPPELSYDDPVWVVLAEGPSGFWQVESLHDQLPESAGPVLRGVYHGASTDSITMRFPIDRFFAPKLRAQELEDLRSEDRLGVILALSPEGDAAIKGITIDGARIYEEPLY